MDLTYFIIIALFYFLDILWFCVPDKDYGNCYDQFSHKMESLRSFIVSQLQRTQSQLL